ncbi:MAG: sensory rhodopsin transducer [Anaerolineae bacterium]
MAHEYYVCTGFTHRPTPTDPRSGDSELVIYNPGSQPAEAQLRIYFADRAPVDLPPVHIKAETNEKLVMPDVAPEVFTDCGFWGARVSSSVPLMLNMISALRITPPEPVRAGAVMNFLDGQLGTEWLYPDALYLQWTKLYNGDISKAPFPFNEIEHYHFLNPGPRPAEITIHVKFSDRDAHDINRPDGVIGSRTTFQLTVPPERLLVWDNTDKVPYCVPHTFRVVCSEPVATGAVRYIFGLKGFDHWGVQPHMCMWPLPGSMREG